MLNAVGREIPEEILERTGKEVFQGNNYMLIPGVGAVIGGSFDLVETKIIANRAYNWFIEGDYSENDKKQ